MRRDLLLIVAVACVALAVRMYPAWDAVFEGSGVSFLETDAWYHVRLIEHQVRNFPWRVTLDPYAAAGGQFVPIAPLFDTLVSTVVVVIHGRDSSALDVERIAAFFPPLLGTATVVVAWALGTLLFDRRAGLLAAAFLAILPGHFLDRTMLGFVDHHALEALLALLVLWSFARVFARPNPWITGAVGGLAIGLYLLSWGSGAFLLAILGVWLLALIPLRPSSDTLLCAGTAAFAASVVALVLVAGVQEPRMHRYGSQVIGLIVLASIAIVVWLLGRAGPLRPSQIALALAGTVLGAAALSLLLPSGLANQMVTDLGRLTPDATRMGVLEARPLFLYSGQWNWGQPWAFFRTGFFIGALALVPFAVRVWKRRHPADLLLLVYAVTTFVATIGQNRFGYYLVTACALLGGWLAAQILDWGGVPHLDASSPAQARPPFAREAAVVVVAGVMFAPNLAPRALLAERATAFPAYWQQTMAWLREETSAPFAHSVKAGDGFYYQPYPRDQVPSPDYTVMNWWDQGYWLTQRAHRVPVANPTQERAPNAARFYAETDETRALELLRAERSRYVVADWELPYRRLADGTIMGRFQNVLDWAGAQHDRFYEIVYRRNEGEWSPLWIFREDYYKSMAFRLVVLGGAAGVASGSTTLLKLADRVDANGVRFREVLTERTVSTFAAAQQAFAADPALLIVGLDPWVPAFDTPGLPSFREVHAARTPEQKPGESPWVRVFEVR